MDHKTMKRVTKLLHEAADEKFDFYEDLKAAVDDEDWDQVLASIDDIQINDPMTEMSDLSEMRKAAQKLSEA